MEAIMEYDPLELPPDTNLELRNQTVDQFDALEEENAALRKAVSKLQAEVLGLVNQKWVKLEDHQALLAWAAKAEAVRVAAEQRLSCDGSLHSDGWEAMLHKQSGDRLASALSSCPALESVKNGGQV
jgi:hypothetical protein